MLFNIVHIAAAPCVMPGDAVCLPCLREAGCLSAQQVFQRCQLLPSVVSMLFFYRVVTSGGAMLVEHVYHRRVAFSRCMHMLDG